MDQTRTFQDAVKAIRSPRIKSDNVLVDSLGKYRAKSSIFFKEASNVVNFFSASSSHISLIIFLSHFYFGPSVSFLIGGIINQLCDL